jgi:hypothetical protein
MGASKFWYNSFLKKREKVGGAHFYQSFSIYPASQVKYIPASLVVSIVLGVNVNVSVLPHFPENGVSITLVTSLSFVSSPPVT